MKRTIIIFLLLTLLVGCQQAVTKRESAKEKAISNLTMQNIMNEDIELLAIKYSMNADKLVSMLSEYEKMTMGFSITETMHNIDKLDNSDNAEQEIVGISSAIAQLSQKYQIPEQALSAIIIDKKMMELSDNNE